MSAPPSDRNSRSTQHNDALCVLWHPREQSPDPALVESLHRKGLRTIACDNPIEVAAWMCTMSGRKPSASHVTTDPHSSSVTASPLQESGSLRPMVLLMDRPGDLLGAADMMAAMARYAPASVCWVHDPAASPRLRIIPWKKDAAPAPVHAASPSSHARHPAPATHTLRLAGDGPVSAELDPAVPPAKSDPSQVVTLARTPRDILTDEELAMLLGDAPGPEQSPHSRR
jgi:hypothetical protein